jgi:hypothetical protein
MKNANDKSLRCVCPRSATLAVRFWGLALATLATGCGAEPTPEEEEADLAALTAPVPPVPVALDHVNPPPIPIVRPSFPPPATAPPSPAPIPTLRPREPCALAGCSGVRERRLAILLSRDESSR